MKQDSQVEYPTTFEEFLNWFQIEEDCAKYIHKLRWPDGFTCPKCGGRKTWPTQRQVVRCAACNHQASVTAGTVRIPASHCGCGSM